LGHRDQATKFIWAVAGLLPAAMFVTGAVMWWNRLIRKKSFFAKGVDKQRIERMNAPIRSIR
jgi:uncharacterized iron-regulated membrane protein